MKGIKYDRADVILGGAIVLATALDEGGFDAIEVTEAGLREGVFFERLLGERELFEDVRSESVHNLSHRFGHDAPHDQHVWTPLAGDVRRARRRRAPRLRRARSASCSGPPACCTTSAWRSNYDDHHRHSHYLILNAGLPGFSPRELILIGLIARYHRKGEPDASELGDLKQPGDDQRLQLLCGVIRLAEQLERSRDHAITDVRVSANGGAVSLAAAATPRATRPCRSGRRAATSDLLAEALGARGRDPRLGEARLEHAQLRRADDDLVARLQPHLRVAQAARLRPGSRSRRCRPARASSASTGTPRAPAPSGRGRPSSSSASARRSA